MSDNRIVNPKVETVIALIDYLYSLASSISIEASHSVRDSEWTVSNEVSVNDIERYHIHRYFFLC